MTRRPNYHADDEGESDAGDELYEECEVCHQEYDGACPIASADCPYVDADDEEEDDVPDFEDVENLDELIGDDEEIEKIIEEDISIPVEDLRDDDAEEAEPEPDDTPSKTVEELEEEALAAKKKKRVAKAPAKKSKK